MILYFIMGRSLDSPIIINHDIKLLTARQEYYQSRRQPQETRTQLLTLNSPYNVEITK